MKLVIVESPAKAKTIEKILGKDYKVVSSFGHIRDLAKDGDKHTGIDITKDYKPHYVVPDDKKKVVADLTKLVKKSKEVILATDEDREGEAISWHLAHQLKLDTKKTKRIVFTEITPEAITHAIENPRTIDKNLVDAQQARRVLDRLVGFDLSGLLWKKIRGKLSAGRVQSAAVKLIVEREREIKNFKPDRFFKVTAQFSANESHRNTFKAELDENIKQEKTAHDFLDKCKDSKYNIKAVTVSPQKKKPYPPFTTSTLQQSAAIKLGFSVSRTMRTAQKLYESGYITYMRTDSTNLSKTALAQMAKYIESNFGKKYLTVRQYAKSSKNAQEAHEAIRPTYVSKEHVTSDTDGQKLYELIRVRALSSQMADAEVEKTTIDISISKAPQRTFVARGEIILFDGFLKLYKNAADEVFLPKLTDGQEVFAASVEALERTTKPPARYGEASLVKKLEELGIGRPSTYAPTIDKITSATRGYITKESRDGDPVSYKLLELKNKKIIESVKEEMTGSQKNKLFAQDIALLVTDFLDDHFSKIMNYSFTAQVEDKLDDVSLGKEKWIEVVDEYYKPFIKTVESTLKKAERVTGERILGKDPKSGKTLLVRMSKFGPVAQIGSPDELKKDEKPQYANLRKDQDLETISREEALTLFSLPKELGSYKNFSVIESSVKPLFLLIDAYRSLHLTNGPNRPTPLVIGRSL